MFKEVRVYELEVYVVLVIDNHLDEGYSLNTLYYLQSKLQSAKFYLIQKYNEIYTFRLQFA